MKGLFKVYNEKYVVNEEKGIVTYFIKFKDRNFNKKYSCYYIWEALRGVPYDANEGCNFIVGVAKCNPEDKFDLTKGIQIARNRAEIKLAQIEQMVIRILCKEIGRVWDYTSALYNNRSEMIKEKKQFIKNI